MKVAVLGESEVDEVAVRILVDGLLAKPTESPTIRPMLTRGFPAVFNVLPGLVKHLHYRTDADALVVVLDSDLTPVHQKSHDAPGACDAKCRYCHLCAALDEILSHVRPRHHHPALRTAVGLAVPQIEAWCLTGVDPHMSEAAWSSGRKSGKLPFARENLKRKLYGTDRPSLGTATRRVTEEVQRIVREDKLGQLEALFPSGFGLLAADVRSW